MVILFNCHLLVWFLRAKKHCPFRDRHDVKAQIGTKFSNSLLVKIGI